MAYEADKSFSRVAAPPMTNNTNRTIVGGVDKTAFISAALDIPSSCAGQCCGVGF